jgi:hypothetical protein
VAGDHRQPADRVDGPPVTYPDEYREQYQVSPKSRSVALALSIALGFFGAHRFYAGKIGTGILMLVTFGGLGFWQLYDIVMVGTGNFRDAAGRRLLEWDPTDADDPYRELPPAVAAELAALRSELDEMHERLDFTERLLSRSPSDRGEDRA